MAFPDLHRVERIDPTPRATTWTSPLATRVASSREEALELITMIEAGNGTIQRVQHDEVAGTSRAGATHPPGGTGLLRDRPSRFIVYSDGSGEDGQVGAAAVAAHPSGGMVSLRAYLGPLTHHTVFESELYGILLALRIVADTPGVDDVLICLDNQSAIVRAHNPRPKSGQLITNAIHARIAHLRKTRPNLNVTLVWVPGHEDIPGNELADLHAKRAAARDTTPLATIRDHPLPDSAAALRATFKKAVRVQWQTRWASSERGRRYARFDSSLPSAKIPRAYHGLKRSHAALLTQLRTGHVALNHYLHRIHAVDSPLCLQCGEPETVDHFLLRCSRFRAPRQALRSQLKGQILSARSLLGSRKNLSALMTYIDHTGRFEIRTPYPTQSSSSQS